MENEKLFDALARLQTGVDAIAREQASMREDMTGMREDMAARFTELDGRVIGLENRIGLMETGMNRRFDFLAAMLQGLRKPVDVSDIPGDTYADKLIYLLQMGQKH